MFILNIAKWLLMVVLVVTNTVQVFLYVRIKKVFDRLPIVAATIEESRLLDFNDERGSRVYEARVRFSYRFRGKDYESETPALKSPQLFNAWNYEWRLVEKYSKGEIVNARVVGAAPQLAYLEVAPFSLASAVLLPVITLVYAALILGYGWFLWYGFNELAAGFSK